MKFAWSFGALLLLSWIVSCASVSSSPDVNGGASGTHGSAGTGGTGRGGDAASAGSSGTSAVNGGATSLGGSSMSGYGASGGENAGEAGMADGGVLATDPRCIGQSCGTPCGHGEFPMECVNDSCEIATGSQCK